MSELNLLQTKAKEWALKVVELHKTPVPDNLLGQKNALIATAKTIKNGIEKITGPLDYLSPMNQLGFIPIIIGAGAIAWAIAAITKWTLDYSKFKTEINQFNSLVKGGMTPQQAANVVGSKKELSWTNVAKFMVPALGIGALVYFVNRKKRSE